MSTIADSITRTKRLLNSNTRTELDAIHTGITDSGPTIRLKYQTDGIRAGSYISVEDGTNPPETMYVHSRNGEYITVQRAMDGSAGYAWTADTKIEVEPRFTGFQILEAVRDAIRFMPNNLYAVGTTSATFSTTSLQTVDVAALNDQDHDTPGTGFLHVISATRTARNDQDRLLDINVRVQRQTDGTYKLIRQEGIEKAVTVNLIYAYPFKTGTLNLGTTLASLGMSSSMSDIPALGGAISLILGEESLRLDLHSQGDSRTDSAVAAGDRARYSLILQAQYDRRVSQEARRLMSLYGVKTGRTTSSVFPTTLR